MTSEEQRVSRRGPAMLLALIASFLLGGQAPASVFADPLPSGIKSLQPGKITAPIRTARRASEDQLDLDDATPLWLDAAPRIETQILSVRPGTAGLPAPLVATARPSRAPFHARAPPAA